MEKIFVTSDNRATLVCNACGNRQRRDVSRFTGLQQEVRLKWRCTCGEVNRVVLERRNFIRIIVNLRGTFSFYSQDGRFSMAPMVVVNLSRGGLQFKREAYRRTHPFQEGDHLTVQFDLDDKNKSSITREVVVSTIRKDGTVGAEFLSKEHYDPLGTYIAFSGHPN